MTTSSKPQIGSQASKPKETLSSWLSVLFKAALKELPKRAKSLAIQLGIVLLFQFTFWWSAVSQYIPSFIAGPIIFLTATYNDVLPKTIYWIIIFTFGKRLFKSIQKNGVKEALRPIKQLKPELMNSLSALRQKAWVYLSIGAGVGLIVANNFASYSRFSGARNKFDKYFIALVISFTISYLLGEGRKHWIFKAARLIFSDLAKALKLKYRYTDFHTYVILSGFILGLLLDAPLIFMQVMYGGYVCGLILIGIGILLNFTSSKPAPKHEKALG
jgi:hypothetical protein